MICLRVVHRKFHSFFFVSFFKFFIEILYDAPYMTPVYYVYICSFNDPFIGSYFK